MIDELEMVVLTEALPEWGLEPGDVGTVVLVHREGQGYEVEFLRFDGSTVAVETVLARQVRVPSDDEIMSARRRRSD